MTDEQVLRPIERRILELHRSGATAADIGERFKRSPEHIERILHLAQLPGRRGHSSERGGLRALERRVLRWRAQGLDHNEIGRRFQRSPRSIRQVEGLALYKKSLAILSQAN